MCITRAFIYVLYITSRAHFNPTSEWRHPKQKLWQISSKHLSSPPSVSDPRHDLQPCPNRDGLSDNEKDNPKQTNPIAIGAYKSLSIYIVSGLFACRVYAWLHDFWGRPRMTLVTMHSMSVRGVRFRFFFSWEPFFIQQTCIQSVRLDTSWGRCGGKCEGFDLWYYFLHDNFSTELHFQADREGYKESLMSHYGCSTMGKRAPLPYDSILVSCSVRVPQYVPSVMIAVWIRRVASTSFRVMVSEFLALNVSPISKPMKALLAFFRALPTFS